MSQDRSHSERVRSYFDDHADSWSRIYVDGRDGFRRRARDVVIIERLNLALELTSNVRAGARVLDAGCGPGALTVALAKRGYQTVAVDLSPEMVELCRNSLLETGLGHRVQLLCGDILELETTSEGFDVIYALGFLQYQQDELSVLRHLKHLLKPGGRLVVSGPIQRRIGNVFGLQNHISSIRRRLWRTNDDPDWIEVDRLLSISTHYYSLRRIRLLLREAGFGHLESRPHGFVNYFFIGPAIGLRGELALHRFFTKLSRVIPIGRFANDIVSLAVRPKQ